MRWFGLVLASLLVACGSDGSGAGASGASGGSGGAGGAGGAGGLGGAGAGGASGGAGGASGGAGGASGGAGGASGGAGGMLPACIAVPDCSAAPPDPGPSVSWNHFLSSVTAASGSPNHRGRDLFLNPGDEQWVLAKFAYGVLDDDIQDEVVDVWLYRDCSSWELLGSALTTADGQHPTVEGVEDTGGRVYFQIPANEKLGVGRHRVHLVVRGDLTSTDQYIEVVPKGTPVFVSDVDGTLTTYETEEFVTLLTGALPDMNPDAAAALNLLAGHGYRPFYLTARPEYLGQRTRDFLDQNGFSPGIVHTTLSLGGALGGSASTYKIDELAWLASKGMVPFYAFGNTSTDADAYAASGVAPDDHRVFFQFDDTAHGGRRIEAYTELLGELGALPDACE